MNNDGLYFLLIDTEERKNDNICIDEDCLQLPDNLFFLKNPDGSPNIIEEPHSQKPTRDSMGPLSLYNDDQTLLDDYDLVYESKPLFEVVNYAKTPGRIPENKKNELQKNLKKIPFYSVHSNRDFDNILRKIKVQFHKFILGFVKLLLRKEFPSEYKNLNIKKIHAKVTQNVTIEFNKKQLNSTLYEFLTQEISPKYKQSGQNSNALNLQYAMARNRKLFKLLKMTYKDFYVQFFLETNSNFLEFYDECKNLPRVLNKLDNQNNYRDDFEKIARNSLLAHFQSNKSRRRKSYRKQKITSSEQYNN